MLRFLDLILDVILVIMKIFKIILHKKVVMILEMVGRKMLSSKQKKKALKPKLQNNREFVWTLFSSVDWLEASFIKKQGRDLQGESEYAAESSGASMVQLLYS